jgi:hypothetical protein
LPWNGWWQWAKKWIAAAMAESTVMRVLSTASDTVHGRLLIVLRLMFVRRKREVTTVVLKRKRSSST